MTNIEYCPVPFEKKRGYEVNNSQAMGRLDITMRTTPTGLHYDPEQISIPTPEDTRRLLRRSSLLHLTNTPLLMPGAVQLNDRFNKHAAFTTFGGTMQITPFGENVEVSIISSGAPILDLRDPKSPDSLIASEFEAHLAKKRAEYLIEMCRHHGYSPNAAIIEFNTAIAQLTPGENLETFLQTTLAEMQTNRAKRQALISPMREFAHSNEVFIGTLRTANELYSLATSMR